MLTGLDYALLAVLLLSVVTSVWRGFLREAFAIIAWVCAIVLSIGLASPLSQWLPASIHSPAIRFVTAFVFIVAVVLLVGFMLGWLCKSILYKTGLGLLDRGLGLVFGVVRGVLVGAVMVMLVQVTAMADSTWYKQSELVPRFIPVVVWMQHFLPQRIQHFSHWVKENKPEVSKSLNDTATKAIKAMKR